MNIFLTSPISFPGLGIEGINPPDGFSIPGTNFEIKFYGVIIAIGVLLAVTYCLRRAKQFGPAGAGGGAVCHRHGAARPAAAGRGFRERPL